ncbi:MAG: 3-deoxy-D-manno-octulosonic acid kinase [Gammaproteobacteria bacterium]|nr:MAG: 3-deoxy-D-manno-octulosonic acid kinase [Gammaproteobacteria bacterium]
MKPKIQPMPDGAILFDSDLLATADARWFDADRVEGARTQAGRGSVVFFDAPFGACVLRHFQRGGMIARLFKDTYFFTGRKRTRGFREFKLLAELNNAGLAVPAPVMARYVRKGLRYRADLITRQIPGAQTLAERLQARTLDAVIATRTGRVLAALHAWGVWHADLNAHNLLIDGSGQAWLIDFDRCRKRKPAMSWQQANLDRLLRSFRKLQAQRHMADFEDVFWHSLLAAYHRNLAERYARGERA